MENTKLPLSGMTAFDVRYSISTNLLGYPYEIKNRLVASMRDLKEPKNKFVIFTTGRSGSTLLLDLLNSDETIQCDGEILKRKVFSPKRLVALRSQIHDKETYGFKLLSYQLRDVQRRIKQKRDFLLYLQDQGYKVIYLLRENRVLQAVSNLYAMQHNDWHSDTHTDSQKKPFLIDIRRLRWMLDGLEGLNRFEQNILKDIQHHKVVYEKDLYQAEKHEATVEKICQFMEIKTIKPKTQLVKAMPNRLQEVISNYEDLFQYVLKSPYEVNLD